MIDALIFAVVVTVTLAMPLVVPVLWHELESA
jgi:hypothetical protein